MAQTLEYKKIPPKEKEKLSRRLAALLYLHRQVKIWAQRNRLFGGARRIIRCVMMLWRSGCGGKAIPLEEKWILASVG